MRRLAHALLVLLILPALVTGQVTVTSSGSFDPSATIDFTGTTNFTSTVKVYQTSTHSGVNWLGLGTNGTTEGLISAGFSSDTTTNIAAQGYFRIVNAAFTTGRFAFLTNAAPQFRIGSDGSMGFSSSTEPSSTANDTFLTREAAATLQMGADVNGAAITQTLKAADGITGTDVIGSGLTLAPGIGTGAGVSQPVTIKRDLVGATGTTAQTQGPAYVACPTKILSNSSATAQTLATITTTSTTGGSVKMFFTTVANNGTLQDTDAGEIVIGWNNNAGTVAVAASAIYGQMDSDASGTLATTPTVTAATNVVSIKFTPTWVTIVPTTVTGFATFEVNGVNNIACQ